MQMFAVPLVIAVCSVVGLVTALLHDGGWHVLASGALATPLAAVAWAFCCRRY